MISNGNVQILTNFDQTHVEINIAVHFFVIYPTHGFRVSVVNLCLKWYAFCTPLMS